jgi:UDP-N-acetylglucosamine 2-epimerase (non-hydrolysing)
MRILVATDQWFPDVLGGAARVASDSARMLAARGHQVVVIAPRAKGGPLTSEEDGVRVQRLLSRSVLPKTLTDPVGTRRYADSLGLESFDVLLAHESTVAAGLLNAAGSVPLVYAYHASAPRELRFIEAHGAAGLGRVSARLLVPYLQRLERRVALDADRILVLSDFSRSLLTEDHGVGAGRVAKVGCGVDLERFSPGASEESRARLGIPGDGRLLFTARRLEARMGIDRAIRALSDLPADVSLAVAGTGSMETELAAVTLDLGLADRVRFLGRVGDDELVDWYRAADLVVLPTVAYEGFGKVTAEALACGTPVVGTPVGATPELLEPLEPTLVAAGTEPADLAEAIGRTLVLAAGDLPDRCREYAEERFSWEIAAAEWESVLEDAVRGGAAWETPSVDKTGVRMRPRKSTSDLLVVAGARPNFMKAASIVHEAEQAGLSYSLVHTGQHYDHELSQVFFEELDLPEPDVYLGVGSASHAEQTARIMLAFEAELLSLDPSIVLVVGDVNSTLACALVAAKEHYAVAHVEAGLRCGDAAMAEEINRKLCDHLSAYLFTTSPDASKNLIAEGIPAERVSFVGNTMIDTLLRFAESARQRNVPAGLGLRPGEYGVATLHRPENVDSPQVLGDLVGALTEIAVRMPIVVPLHPRTAERLSRFGLADKLTASPGIRTSPPLGYLDFVGLLADAHLVLTDSGGVQEEATVLGVPCLTLRDSTERPVTVEMGTNRVVGRDPERIVSAAAALLGRRGRLAGIPELWDGRAGERIVAQIRDVLYEGQEAASANA